MELNTLQEQLKQNLGFFLRVERRQSGEVVASLFADHGEEPRVSISAEEDVAEALYLLNKWLEELLDGAASSSINEGYCTRNNEGSLDRWLAAERTVDANWYYGWHLVFADPDLDGPYVQPITAAFPLMRALNHAAISLLMTGRV